MLHATRTFAQPSPIQAQCWPILQSGHDLVGIAATGSGKTLAFGLPALRHILAQRAAGVFTGELHFLLQSAHGFYSQYSSTWVRAWCIQLPQTGTLRLGVSLQTIPFYSMSY